MILNVVLCTVFVFLASASEWSSFPLDKMMYADTTRAGKPWSKNPFVLRFGGRYLMYSSVLAPKGGSAREIEITESKDLIHWKNVGYIRVQEPYEAKGISAPCALVKDGKVHLFYQTYGNGTNDAICHAVSDDGVNDFRRDPTNPIFRPDGAWNCGRAIDAEVFFHEGRYLLYYATRDPSYKIQMQGVAAAPANTSFRRGEWTHLSKAGPILKPELAWEGDCIEAASIIRRNGLLYMFYAGSYDNTPQQIGVASSKDGLKWQRLFPTPFLRNGKPGEWNSSESGHPCIFDDGDRTWLFYQGNPDHGHTWLLSNVEVFWDDSGPILNPTDAAAGQATALQQAAPQKSGPRNPHPDAQWFPDAGLGLFIHWGLASVSATGDLSWGMLTNKPWKDATVTPNFYYAQAKRWKPDAMNYDQMLAEAKAAGFTYAVMVTKHHDGFTLWPSAFGDLGTKYTFGGRDFVKEFVAACRKHGLKVGLYYSPPDWWFDREYKSFSMRGPAVGMDHQPVKLPARPKDHDAKRAELVRGQVRELLKNYGKIDLIWFDGGHGEIPNAEVRELQPGIVINRRNGGGGDYGDSEGNLPTKRFSGWFETCETCWPSKKWSYTEGQGWDTAPEVIEELVRLRAWGGNLLANLGPKGDGSIPELALSAWKDMSSWMQHSRESVIGAKAGPWPAEVNVPVTTRAGVAYVHLLPGFRGEVVWTNAPKVTEARLLRTKESIPLKYEGGNLHLTVPDNLRTTNVDVVKIILSEQTK